jgi:hypothetical protein
LNLNGPTHQLYSVTVSGAQFGVADMSASIRMGTTLCASLKYSSATAILCQLPMGTGPTATKFAAITVQGIVGTGDPARSFTYDRATITQLNPYNLPSNGLGSLTISGYNFGGDDATPTAVLTDPLAPSNQDMCATVSWTSLTLLNCAPPSTYGGPPAARLSRHAILTVSAIVGTQMTSSQPALAFSFDSAAITYGALLNSPTSGGASVTITGLNFGGRDLTGTVVIVTDTCGTTTWTTSTSVSCGTPQSTFPNVFGPGWNGNSFPTGVPTSFVAAVAGTRAQTLTFDAPSVSALAQVNAAPTGSESVTITGLNFFYTQLTATAGLSGTLCTTTSWTTATLVNCRTGPTASISNIGTVLSAVVSLASLVGSGMLLMTFDAPVASFVNLRNVPSYWPTTPVLSVLGYNFQAGDTTASILVGSTRCSAPAWISNTLMTCGPGSVRGAGYNRQLSVVVGGIVGTVTNMLNTLTFDSPVLTLFNPSNTATATFTTLTLLGMNFNPGDETLSITLGPNLCGTVSWSTSSLLTCFSAAPSYSVVDVSTAGKAKSTLYASVFTAMSAVGTGYSLFTFDAAVPSLLQPVNAAATGQVTVTVSGGNFAATDLTMTAQIHEDVCSTSAWTSSSSARCYVPPASGPARRVIVTVGNVAGTTPLLTFSFDGTVACAAVRLGTCSTRIAARCAQLLP